MTNNSSKAFSLIELLLVISIISVILFGTMNYYKKSRFEIEMNRIKQNAEQLGQSLNLYYYLVCKQEAFNRPVTLQQLQDAKLLPDKAMINVPWAIFSLQISRDAALERAYQLWVIAKIEQPLEVINYIKGQLNAVDAPDGDITKIAWMRLPSQKVATMNTADWIMGAGLQQFNKAFRTTDKSDPCVY